MKGTAYLFQSVLIIIWWILITLNEDIYSIFSYSAISVDSYFNLLVPDLGLLGILSLIRAYKTSRDLSLIILGAFSYATLFCINATITGLDGFLPTTVMIFGLAFNLLLCYPKSFLKESSTSNKYILVVKTTIQIISFWTLFLGIIPGMIIYTIFGKLELPDSIIIYSISSILFVLFSLLGLSSAYVMVKFGEGTPLPVDATKELVIAGPYKYLRNPMAVAGVGQILSITIVFKALPLVIYAIIGGIAWHIIVRPIEEKDLQERFGTRYLTYKSNTACWIPFKKT